MKHARAWEPRLLRHPPSADSITRRLAAIDAAIARATTQGD
jgi:hypothetical protein